MTRQSDGGEPEEFRFDRELLADVEGTNQDQREREWTRVFEHFDPRLRGHFRALVPDEMALDDLLGRIWFAAIRHLPTLTSDRTAWSYMAKIGHNALRDDGRRSAASRRKLAAYSVLADLEVPADADASPTREGWPIDPDQLESRIQSLRPEDRRLFDMRHEEGLSHEEIAERLGIDHAAARKRYSRILVRLREPLVEDG